MAVKSIRALSDKSYEYYRLTKDIGELEAGAIFYYDEDDDIYGSIAFGCLKLCWTPDGNCYNGYAGGTVIFHSNFRNTDLFEKVDFGLNGLADSLKDGTYKLVIRGNSWELQKQGYRE